MEKQVLRRIKFCDICGTDQNIFYKCSGCGKDICCTCQEKNALGQKFCHAVNFPGSIDCYLCMECLAKPTPKVKTILSAYLKIQQLRNERTAFNDDFDVRCKAAEAKVKEVADSVYRNTEKIT